MKVLIADTFEPIGIDGLKACGCEVLYEPTLKDESLAGALRQSGAEVLGVRSTRVSAAMLDSGHLSLIVRAGAGYSTIDVAAASELGIYVSNCPGKNAVAVAELAFGLIPGTGPAHSGQRGRAASRAPEQEGIFAGTGPARSHARRFGHRQHRPRNGQTRRSLRHAGRHLESAFLGQGSSSE